METCKVLLRMMEAANTHAPKGAVLHITGNDDCLMIKQYTRTKTPPIVGFIRHPPDSLGIRVSTMKYTGNVGNPVSKTLRRNVGVYTLVKCLWVTLKEDKESTIGMMEELLSFADHVVESNPLSNVGYKLTQDDIVEYNFRHPNGIELQYGTN